MLFAADRLRQVHRVRTYTAGHADRNYKERSEKRSDYLIVYSFSFYNLPHIIRIFVTKWNMMSH